MTEAEAYAWECAENMRGWAMRAEAAATDLREQNYALRRALGEALPKIAKPQGFTTSRYGVKLLPGETQSAYSVKLHGEDPPF